MVRTMFVDRDRFIFLDQYHYRHHHHQHYHFYYYPYHPTPPLPSHYHSHPHPSPSSTNSAEYEAFFSATSHSAAARILLFTRPRALVSILSHHSTFSSCLFAQIPPPLIIGLPFLHSLPPHSRHSSPTSSSLIDTHLELLISLLSPRLILSPPPPPGPFPAPILARIHNLS